MVKERFSNITLIFLTFIYIALIVMVSLLPQAAESGQLDSFEDSVKNESYKGQQQENHTRQDNCAEGHAPDCSFGDDLFDIFFNIIIVGGDYSFRRAASASSTEYQDEQNTGYRVSPRKPGEALIPLFRFDGTYQPYKSDVSAQDYRLEVGYGPFAVSINKTSYSERNPRDSLSLSRAYGAYRMSYGPRLEVDFGVGTLKVEGNERKSYAFLTLPILYYPTDSFGFEVRPSWAANISDYDFSAFVSQGYCSLKFGYRIVKTNSQSLDGPYIGLSVRY